MRGCGNGYKTSLISVFMAPRTKNPCNAGPKITRIYNGWTVVRPIHIWMKNCGEWHETLMWLGTAAGIPCRGRMQEKTFGFVNAQTASKCTMVRSGSPFMSEPDDIVR